jgi:hypothetical protein
MRMCLPKGPDKNAHRTIIETKYTTLMQILKYCVTQFFLSLCLQACSHPTQQRSPPKLIKAPKLAVVPHLYK